MDHDMELPREMRDLEDRARRRETPCGDGHIAWRLWGEGEPVVLLHGGSGSWTHWLRNIPAVVGAGRMAVVPDLPGFGESSVPPGGGDADAVVAPVAEGLARLVGERPVDIVAFSFGSLVAALLASQMPQRVSRLLLVGAPVVPLQRGRGVDLKPWSLSSTPQERLRIHRHNLGAIMLHQPQAIDDVALSLQAHNVTRDRMRRRRLVTTPAFQEAIRGFQCPFSAIYGGEDVLMDGLWPQVKAALCANPRFGGMTVIPDTGHWVQFEAAERFNEAMLSALAA
ncbi:alpha/beta fold hydrolase [Ramlibacter sp. Leaf400]|uniref:alpha/beta fold hydrolase n=1 Tax=Ramlibacter sp. Leaf400 TaxID=1736365 RepID=UPI000A9658F1|nr:alpha/beta hydrolase [Ramlibacter sp. Leaf400]